MREASKLEMKRRRWLVRDHLGSKLESSNNNWCGGRKSKRGYFSSLARYSGFDTNDGDVKCKVVKGEGVKMLTNGFLIGKFSISFYLAWDRESWP